MTTVKPKDKLTPESARALFDAQPRLLINKLYRDTNGFVLVGVGPDGAPIRRKVQLVYGELTARGVTDLMGHLDLGPKDVFYDLGSGVGKVVLQIAMTTRLKKCVGVELASERHEGALGVLKEARKLKLILGRKVEFRNESIVDTDFSDATVLYACSTCLSTTFLYDLARRIVALGPGRRFVSLRELPRKPRGLELVKSKAVHTSWARTQIAHFYRTIALP